MPNSTQATVVIRAPKRLDALTAPHLSMDFDKRIPPGGVVILDLSQTQFVDPESADKILQGLMLAKQRHARFSLRGVNHQTQLVLEMAGILQYFRRT